MLFIMIYINAIVISYLYMWENEDAFLLVIIFLIAFFLDLNVIDTNLLLSGDVKFNEVVIKIQLLNHAF